MVQGKALSSERVAIAEKQDPQEEPNCPRLQDCVVHLLGKHPGRRGKICEWGAGVAERREGGQSSKGFPKALSIHTPSSTPGDEKTGEDLVRFLRESRVERDLR